MKRPGDVFYPQYSVIQRMPIDTNVSITKGRLYTTDGEGNLVVPVAANGFERGIFQSQRDVPADAGPAGTNRVDCFGARSRVGVTAGDGLGRGDRVRWDYANNKVELLSIAGNNPTKTELLQLVGSIYAIHTKASITQSKAKTADGDIVVIELGGAL